MVRAAQVKRSPAQRPIRRNDRGSPGHGRGPAPRGWMGRRGCASVRPVRPNLADHGLPVPAAGPRPGRPAFAGPAGTPRSALAGALVRG